MRVLECNNCKRGLLDVNFRWVFYLSSGARSAAESDRTRGIIYKSTKPTGSAAIGELPECKVYVRCNYCDGEIDYEAQGFVIIRDGNDARLVLATAEMESVL